MIPIAAFLVFTSALFCLGLYGIISKRNAVRIIMGIELMLNAGIINFVVFAVYGPINNYYNPAASITVGTAAPLSGTVIAFIMIALAAAEAAVGLSILLVLYRNWQKIDVSEMDLLQG
ncbi:MAG: NADH-quinone oxidoreductase subunit NuoK [Candidatus Thorarchaeota archaeon]